MNPTSPQSDIENLLNTASTTNDDAQEIRRLEADLQRRLRYFLALTRIKGENTMENHVL